MVCKTSQRLQARPAARLCARPHSGPGRAAAGCRCGTDWPHFSCSFALHGPRSRKCIQLTSGHIRTRLLGCAATSASDRAPNDRGQQPDGNQNGDGALAGRRQSQGQPATSSSRDEFPSLAASLAQPRRRVHPTPVTHAPVRSGIAASAWGTQEHVAAAATAATAAAAAALRPAPVFGEPTTPQSGSRAPNAAFAAAAASAAVDATPPAARVRSLHDQSPMASMERRMSGISLNEQNLPAAPEPRRLDFAAADAAPASTSQPSQAPKISQQQQQQQQEGAKRKAISSQRKTICQAPKQAAAISQQQSDPLVRRQGCTAAERRQGVRRKITATRVDNIGLVSAPAPLPPIRTMAAWPPAPLQPASAFAATVSAAAASTRAAPSYLPANQTSADSILANPAAHSAATQPDRSDAPPDPTAVLNGRHAASRRPEQTPPGPGSFEGTLSDAERLHRAERLGRLHGRLLRECAAVALAPELELLLRLLAVRLNAATVAHPPPLLSSAAEAVAFAACAFQEAGRADHQLQRQQCQFCHTSIS